ncbi:OmpA family protein [Thalassovita sp.]|uniref:OmpA family protein n=1 Tax=Thalassovita sp. TaxID=1979401 RepID=UPI002B277921|nr:OmpA family protein [Thalassovita sp.]
MALDLILPGSADLLANENVALDSYALPLGPYADGALWTDPIEGHVTRQSWRIAAQGMTSLQLLAPLREQLQQAGYEVLFECDTLDCGGFDFRFETEVLPAPLMHVDLGDFRFLSAQKEPGDYLGLLVSRSANAGFIQLIRVVQPGENPDAALNVKVAEVSADNVALPSDIVGLLVTQGHVVLNDLSFETGSSSLGDGNYASLEALSAFLSADPTRRIALVGHTDAVGDLNRNIALSKKRAASVLERLVSDYGAVRGQLSAEGMGYLAPIAPNQTPEGRDTNRRVEAVLLNTD